MCLVLVLKVPECMPYMHVLKQSVSLYFVTKHYSMKEKKTTKYKSTSAKNFTPLFGEDKQEYMEKD